MPAPANKYELFNFEDPICDAVRTLVGADAILQRESTGLDDISIVIRFTGGSANGHVTTAYDGVKLYDAFVGGNLQIEVAREREDLETVAELEPTDTISQDPLTLIVGQIRYALRHAKTTPSDHLPINDELVCPKITYMLPTPTISAHEAEYHRDYMVLSWSVDYHIPADIWPRVITSNGSYVITTDGSWVTTE